MDDQNLPIGEVLNAIGALPESWTPLEAACTVKCLNEDGRPKGALRVSEGINFEELMGTLTIHLELVKNDLLAEWEDEDD
jgi:hypothetical protein